ncbi:MULTISPECIES: 50S ribosomal protein L29 [Nesterenkonia]|uniref:Large ribosomal subunit protein uL29 n=1 Tax=Nesterenkonia halotolerans TaxID=225325 RepID=A0ABR9J8W4_9MICC|nr:MULTISPECIES: 50S ribosomal protein L29 [Nesterenkonia]MBE1515435.1 large subunit ribosomal protein L29 [Nesterenkonia halotolerans]
MAVGTNELTVEKLAEMDSAGLAEALRSSKEELFNLRFQSATGQLENSSRLRDIKRDIARIYTVLRERELGIRENVDADAASSDSADEQNEEKAED